MTMTRQEQGDACRAAVRRLTALAAAGLCLCSCAHRAAPPTLSVPVRAEAVLGTEDAALETYQWLTPNRVLAVEPENAQWLSGGGWRVSGDYHAFVVSTATGAKRPLRRLEALLQAPGDPASAPPDMVTRRQLAASPDGKWVLFHATGVQTLTGRETTAGWCALSTNGRQAVRWTSPEPPPASLQAAAWLPGSRGWVEIVKSGVYAYLRVYRFHQPKPRTLRNLLGSTINPMYAADLQYMVLGFAPSGALLTKGVANDSQQCIFRITLKGQTAVADILRQDQSRSVGLEDVVLSPDGRRLAYRTGDQSLCVSRLDGSGEHEVTPGPVQTNSIRWTPDSRQVSFGYDSRLFTISADASDGAR